MFKAKKKILIVMPYMKMGGVETSLLSLLKYLDYNKVDVTILLINSFGPLLNDIPKNVKIMEMKFNNKVAELFIGDYQNKATFFQRVFRKVVRELINIKSQITKTVENQIYEYGLRNVEPLKEEYDLAIDYHGYGFFTTAYVAKNVKATKKITWLHDEKMDFLKKVENYLGFYDEFYAVAKSCARIFKSNFPEYANRTEVFYNIIDVNEIKNKSTEPIKDKSFTGDFKIVTVGRLAEQKGYDIAIKAAKIMKDSGYKFKWFAIGDGKLLPQLEKMITDYNLSNQFILLGLKTNPFPYICKADLYVQPSRHEGYGLAIAEAKTLRKPIVATKLDCVMEQIVDGENGFLVDINENDLANRIMDLMDNPEKVKNVVKNLHGNSENYAKQLERLY